MTVTLTCPYCHYSKSIPKDKVPPNAKWGICPRCGQRFDLSASQGGPEFFTGGIRPDLELGGEPKREGSPWEKRSDLGLWQGIYQTFKAVLLSPHALFSTLTFRGGIREPLAFGLLVGGAGSMLEYFWPFLIFSGKASAFAQSVFGFLGVGVIFLVMMVIIPVWATVGMFINSAVLHLLLLLVGSGKNGYEATFRVVCYSQAAQAWELIPFLGGFIGKIWMLVVQIIGLREMHETTYLRVILAFLIPVAIIFLLALAVLIPLILYAYRNWFVQ
jgi:hypothetical protein